VNWESFKTLTWAFLPNRLKQFPMISQLDLPSAPDTIHAMITQFLQWELTGVLWPNNCYVTSYTLCYHSFRAMHCLWKEILSQQRIRHFKNLQSVYFAYDVGLISSYSNIILIQIKSLFIFKYRLAMQLQNNAAMITIHGHVSLENTALKK